MVAAQPHFLLFCDTHQNRRPNALAHSNGSAPRHNVRGIGGRWHFVLEQLDDLQNRFEATDTDREATNDRLALLSVVRGLEALEQPSKVTLVTTSKYVSRGLRYGLNSWRESGYMWERFGVQMPIRNADLWQRISGAMEFHGVSCRLIESHQSSPLSRSSAENSVAVSEQEDPALLPHAYADQVPGADWKPEERNVAMEAVHTDEVNPAIAPARRSFKLKHASRFHVIRSPIETQTETTSQTIVGPSGSENRISITDLLFDHWWQLAAAWIKWWKGRLQMRPMLHGT